ncbi:hypothetical protein CAPTEDRAFT_132362 [Capitella teleta]|uniref:AB hydrolase-1 domain-containing protein n=1 Tax=Capitella teleta TaxID=283909 RepID=R7TNQ8_CAPTE|nr:hypothetical protein CAPTEDRAFT_132362 [Capitella teleta]|eukprot:ELT95508.1 hypothetical protein CAPTEDRAFT_132362 [Capitella teleta]
MPPPVLLLIVGVLLLLIRVLHLASKAGPPRLFCRDTTNNRRVIKLCPKLTENYIPPLLWGKSGHVQTIIYGKMGRINSPFPRGQRHSVLMPDGATSTFDVFEPTSEHPSGQDYSLLICPGIANSSESLYICTCVHFAQEQGFRVAVLNHLGALRDVPLTSPRIFTYGDTAEYGAMVDRMRELYPGHTAIGVGFSMGGNQLIKYLGEHPDHQKKFLCALSCCQGYDVERAVPALMSWEHLRRIYVWAMTLNMQGLLRFHQNALFSPEVCKKNRWDFDLEKIFQASSLLHIDREYTVKRGGFKTLQEFYRWCSSSQYIQNIDIPVFILNSMDDPLIPCDLHDVPKKFARVKDNVIFATTDHGGHLGYFEGEMVIPETITWLDKIVVQYTNAAIAVYGKRGSLAF